MFTYIPFTYLLRFKPTGQVYYGSKYSLTAHPNQLWISYFSSSRKVRALIAEHGKDAFEFEIRRTFKTAAEAVDWESRVLLRFNAKRDPRFLNSHNGDGRPHMVAWTEDQKKRKRASMLRNGSSNTPKNPLTPEQLAKKIERQKATREINGTGHAETARRGPLDDQVRLSANEKKALTMAKNGTKKGPKGPMGPRKNRMTAEQIEQARIRRAETMRLKGTKPGPKSGILPQQS